MKKKIIVILVFLLIIINHFYQLSMTFDKNDHVYNNYSEINIDNNKLHSYTEGKLDQQIIAKKNNFKEIKIKLDPLEKVYKNAEYISTNINITLKDEKEKTVAKYKYDKIFFDGEVTINFEFPTIKDSKGKKYYLYIETYKKDYNLQIQLAENKSSNDGLYINDELTEYSLVYETVYDNPEVNYLAYIITFIIIVIFIILYILISKMDLKIEKQYLIIASILSILMILLTPLFMGQDESSHYARIYELSKGNLTSKIIDNWPRLEMENKAIEIRFNKYKDVKNIYEYSKKMIGTQLVNMEFTSVYSPISYLPQTLGLILAKIIFPASFLWPYVARIFEAIFCIICIYYAIKIIPFGKESVFFIGMVPTVIEATTLLSADSLLLACSILFIAKILEIIYEKKAMEKKDCILLFFLTLVIAISKLVYFPLCLLLLLIPYKLKSKRKELLKKTIIIVCVALLITYIWNIVALNKLISGQGVNTLYYIKHFLKNPLNFVQITFYSFYNQIGNHISDLFGGKNSWHLNTIRDSSIFPQLFFIIYIALISKIKNPFTKKEKIGIGISVFLTYILISTSLLIACTQVDYNQITGIQGRYFISFLLPISLIFSDNKKKEKLKINLPCLMIIIYLAYYLNLIISHI